MGENNITNNSLLGGTIFTFLGVLFIGIGGFIWHGNTQFQQRALVTKGRVIDMRASRSDDGTVYYPVVSYRLQDGALRQLESSVGTNPPRFQVGDEVEVLYDPQKISDVRLKADVEFAVIPIVFIGVGVLFAVIGVFIITSKLYGKA